jgi:NACalpha-BTF3-like transcription factor
MLVLPDDLLYSDEEFQEIVAPHIRSLTHLDTSGYRYNYKETLLHWPDNTSLTTLDGTSWFARDVVIPILAKKVPLIQYINLEDIYTSGPYISQAVLLWSAFKHLHTIRIHNEGYPRLFVSLSNVESLRCVEYVTTKVDSTHYFFEWAKINTMNWVSGFKEIVSCKIEDLTIKVEDKTYDDDDDEYDEYDEDETDWGLVILEDGCSSDCEEEHVIEPLVDSQLQRFSLHVDTDRATVCAGVFGAMMKSLPRLCEFRLSWSRERTEEIETRHEEYLLENTDMQNRIRALAPVGVKVLFDSV